MPNISEYLLKTSSGVIIPFIGTWVRLVNNATAVAYVSTGITDTTGLYTINNVPSGFYTVYTGLSATGPWTTTGDTLYPVQPAVPPLGIFNPLDYGAKGDGVTLDDIAFTNLYAALPASGGEIYIPAGYNFRLSSPLDPRGGLTISGSGINSIISNATSDIFQATSSNDRYQFIIKNISLQSRVGGGHILNFGTAVMVQPIVEGAWLDQYIPAKSMITGTAMHAADIKDSFFRTLGATRSVAMVEFVSTTGSLNDNHFHDLWVQDSNAVPSTWAFHLEENDAGTFASNAFDHITFENPIGGAIHLVAAFKPIIDHIQLWDLSANPTKDLIRLDASAFPTKCFAPRISNVYRVSAGANGPTGGIYDINLGASAGTAASEAHISDCRSSGSVNFSVNCQNATNPVIERMTGSVILLNYRTAQITAASYTAKTTDEVLLVNATSNNVTITIDPASQGTSPVTIKKTDTSINTVTVSPLSGTIDGSTTKILTSPQQSVTFVSDGTNFFLTRTPEVTSFNVKDFGATGNGTTDDGPAIRRALAAVPVGGGIVYFPPGNYKINSADASTNGLTITTKGTILRGAGRIATTITIAINGLVWGITATAPGYCEFHDFSLVLANNITAPYWAIGQSGIAGVSAEGGVIENIYVSYGTGITLPTPALGVSTQGAGAFALGPDSPGAGNIDIAMWKVIGCNAAAPSNFLVGTAFIVGNGTAGNILVNSFRDCYASFFAYAVQLGGSGCSWYGGGWTGIATADILITHTGTDPFLFQGIRGENGNMVLHEADVGAQPAGITLKDCVFVNYTPTVVAGRIITYEGDGALTLIGGFYQTSGANTSFSIKQFGGGFPTVFTAIGVTTDVSTAYPPASANYSRVIIGAMVGDQSTKPTPITNFQMVIDGPLVMGAVASRIIPGATSLSLRNNANSADNLLITDAGVITVRDAFIASKAIQRSRQSPAFAGSLTVNATAGEIVSIGALTGNITINAPTNPAIGQELKFEFTQDGTGGRNVTWNAVFKVNWIPSTVANQVNTISFYYNGTNWIQLSYAGGLT